MALSQFHWKSDVKSISNIKNDFHVLAEVGSKDSEAEMSII